MIVERQMMSFREHLQKIEEFQTPVYGIGLPEVSKTGKVIHLIDNRNPIYIELSGGTKAFLSLDDFRRFGSRPPKIGDQMTLVFLRNPRDTGVSNSTILKAMVH